MFFVLQVLAQFGAGAQQFGGGAEVGDLAVLQDLDVKKRAMVMVISKINMYFAVFRLVYIVILWDF